MSEKKGHLEDEAALRRLQQAKEADERRRRCREAQARDERLREGLTRSISGIHDTLRLAHDIVRRARRGEAGERLAARLAEHDEDVKRLLRGVGDAENRFAELERDFAQATKAWQSAPEFYEAADFDSIDLSPLQRQAETILRTAKRLAGESRALELEASQCADRSTCEAALSAARAALDDLAALAPGAGQAEVLAAKLGEIATQVAADPGREALARLAALQRELTDETEAAGERARRREETLHPVRAAIEDVFAALDLADTDLMATWGAEDWTSVQQRVADLRRQREELEGVTTAVVEVNTAERLLAEARQVIEALGAAVAAAEQRRADGDLRDSLGEKVESALRSLGYEVSISRAGKGAAEGYVLRAKTKRDRQVVMKIGLSRDTELKMSDGVGGADCVADVEKIAAALQASGVTLNVTDWGAASNDRRVKNRSQQLEKRAAGKANQSGDPSRR